MHNLILIDSILEITIKYIVYEINPMTTAHNAQAPTATPAPGAIAAPVAAKSATPTKATPVRATPARRAPTKAVAKKTPVAPEVPDGDRQER